MLTDNLFCGGIGSVLYINIFLMDILNHSLGTIFYGRDGQMVRLSAILNLKQDTDNLPTLFGPIREILEEYGAPFLGF